MKQYFLFLFLLCQVSCYSERYTRIVLDDYSVRINRLKNIYGDRVFYRLETNSNVISYEDFGKEVPHTDIIKIRAVEIIKQQNICSGEVVIAQVGEAGNGPIEVFFYCE